MPNITKNHSITYTNTKQGRDRQTWRRLKRIAIVGFEKQLFKVNFIVYFFWYNAWETYSLDTKLWFGDSQEIHQVP